MTDSGNFDDVDNCLGVPGSFGPTVLTQGCLGVSASTAFPFTREWGLLKQTNKICPPLGTSFECLVPPTLQMTSFFPFGEVAGSSLYWSILVPLGGVNFDAVNRQLYLNVGFDIRWSFVYSRDDI